MSSAATALKPNIWFDALDPDLPFLAASAALELDNLLIGSSSSTEHVEQLARLLFSPSPGQTVSKKFLDPISCSVLTRALSESVGADSATEDESASAISRLSERLEGIIKNSSTQKEQISELRNFFVALSRLASSSRTSIYGEQRVHPYRK